METAGSGRRIGEGSLMKRVVIVLFGVSLVAAGTLESEVLRLKDGSAIRGRVLKMDADTLHFETSFGSRIAVHRDKVAAIDLDETGASAPSGPPPAGAHLQSAEPGTLSVSFDKFEVTSRVVVERGGERESYERENSVELSLLVNGKRIYSVIDSVTDKTVRNGPETVLRNDMRPRDFDVAVAPGIHRCVVAFGNTRASAYTELFEPAPLDRKLVLDPVRIEPGEKTHVRIGMKRKWTGKTELVRIE